MSKIIALFIAVIGLGGTFLMGVRYGREAAADKAWDEGARAIIPFVEDENIRKTIERTLILIEEADDGYRGSRKL